MVYKCRYEKIKENSIKHIYFTFLWHRNGLYAAWNKHDLEKKNKNYKDLIIIKNVQEMINKSEETIFKMLRSNSIYKFKYHAYNYIF